MASCMLCPRRCGADRAHGETGVCGVGAGIYVARAAPHFFEEPPISGERGSGAVFFSGCPLGCVFCQNCAISRGAKGKLYSEQELEDLLLGLAQSGVHNLNLVTAVHYTDRIAEVLSRIRSRLSVPVIWNSGGYERVETLRMLSGLVDIYLPDFKYASSELAAACSGAPDYPEVASDAILEMVRQTGPTVFGPDGMLRRGTVVRHLVLPGCRADSIAVLRKLAVLFPEKEILLSLMSQYTPEFAPKDAPAFLHRRVTTFEYESVRREAVSLGFSGFSQRRDSAGTAYTPDFDL